MPVRAGTVYVDVVPNTAAFASQLKAQVTPAAAAAGTSISAAMTKAGAGLSRVGKSLTRYVSLPLLGIGAVATKMALDYDRAFTTIAATTNASAKQVAGWREEVMALSGETARAPQELAEGLYFLASAGLKASQIMPTLEASAKAAATGMGTTADVARLTANVLNAFPKAGLEATDVIDQLVAAIKVGSAAPDEFANAMGRILPISSKAQVGFDQISASLASLSNIGLDVNEGVTAMRGLLQAIVAPTDAAAETMKDLGISTDELRTSLEQQGLVKTLGMLEDAAKGDIDMLRDLIPNVRSLTGFFGLTEQEASKVSAAFEQVADSKGELDKAFKTTQKSDAFKFQKALNDLRMAAIELGNQIIPILTKTVIPAIEDAVGWFSDLSSETKTLIVQLGGLAILAGPLLRIVGVIARLGGAVAGLTTAGSAATGGGLAALTKLSLIKLGPVAFGIAAVAESIAQIKDAMSGDWEGFADRFQRWAFIVGHVPLVGQATSDLEGFREGVKEIAAEVDDGTLTFQEGADAIRDLGRATKVGLEGVDIGKMLGDAAPEAQKLRRQIAGLTQGYRQLVGHGLDKTTRGMVENLMAAGDLRGALDILRGAIDRDTSAAGRMHGVLKQVARKWVVKVEAVGVDEVTNDLKQVATQLYQLDGSTATVYVNAVGDTFLHGQGSGSSEHGGFVPGAARGGFVNRPTLLMTGEHHKAEMILPLEDQRGARALQTAMERALRAVMADGRAAGGGADARVEVRGFHGVNLRFQQDQDWAYSQWGW